MSSKEPFTALPIKRMAIVGKEPNLYRVYSHSGEYKDVTAQTAYEALQLSGLKRARKIEYRYTILESILDKTKLAPEETSENPAQN